MRLAFTLSDYGHKSQYQTKIVLYDGKLYIREWRHLNSTTNETYHGKDGYRPLELSRLKILNPYEYDKSMERDQVIEKVNKEADRYLIIGNEVWRHCGEPRYVIITFGLGHNHGGTGLFVNTWYNDNISKDRYFNALSVGRFREMIKVHLPETVKCNPKEEHGEGDAFLNMLDSVTQNSGSAAEAGLLTMALALTK